MMTYLPPQIFLDEVKRWGAGRESLMRVRSMIKDKFYYFMFYANGEKIETRMTVEEFYKFDFMNLAPISVPAIWDDETELIKTLIKKLEESNAKPDIDWDYRLWQGQPG